MGGSRTQEDLIGLYLDDIPDQSYHPHETMYKPPTLDDASRYYKQVGDAESTMISHNTQPCSKIHAIVFLNQQLKYPKWWQIWK